jgi:hypothetical protein
MRYSSPTRDMRYSSPTRLLLVICSIVIAGCAEKVSFSADVMPILAEHCLDCHQEGGAGYAASGFSVASYDDVMKGTRNGPVVEAGYSYASTLQVLVQHGADRPGSFEQLIFKIQSTGK